ncbi:MAG: dehydrogenase [Phenylobacterium zucineum]|nr:MAG: dehydrogenase [Phenylobacterium zucineum]
MEHKLALVTGASAGIGAALARVYASHGYDVALTARRADRLEALATEISGRFGVEALTLAADLEDPKAPQVMLDHLAAKGRHVDALINNAGYGLTGTYSDTRWQDQAKFIQVLLTAPSELAHKVLPGMLERRFGRIINVASLAGLVPGSEGYTLYGAVKSFMIKFSQSLHLETRGSGVHVSALCPGFTYSEFHDVTGTRDQVHQITPDWLWMGAEDVAVAGYEAAEANHPVRVPGTQNKAIAAIAKLVPDDLAMALMGGQSRKFRKI